MNYAFQSQKEINEVEWDKETPCTDINGCNAFTDSATVGNDLWSDRPSILEDNEKEGKEEESVVAGRPNKDNFSNVPQPISF